MKNLIKFIILLSLVFSTQSNTFATEKEWAIESLLDLNYGIEAYDIELEELDNYVFNNEHNNFVFNRFKKVSVCRFCFVDEDTNKDKWNRQLIKPKPHRFLIRRKEICEVYKKRSLISETPWG